MSLAVSRLAPAIPATRLMPWVAISQTRFTGIKDFAYGNVATLKANIDVWAASGIKALCVLPINETHYADASLFGRVSSNALNPHFLDLTAVPEIQNNSKLLRAVNQDLKRDMPHTQGRSNLGIVSIRIPEHMEAAFGQFSRLGALSDRKKEFNKFCLEQSEWLTPYAYFKAMQDVAFNEDISFSELETGGYLDMDSATAQMQLGRASILRRLDYHSYVQMEIFRQMTDAFQYAKSKGIEEIELLIGVGVSLDSAEAYFMKDLFDRTRQIGCFPEPENGYPLQLWGFLAEKMGIPLSEFKARAFKLAQQVGATRIGIDHACGGLGGYTTFPTIDENGRWLNPNDPSDAEIAETGGRWDIPLGKEKKRKEHAQTVLLNLLEGAPGIKFSAETVGDVNRRSASEEAIKTAIEKGYDITLMRALPWENVSFDTYGLTDRLSHTHDMPPLTTLLTGRLGEEKRSWIDGEFVSNFLRRLGVLAFEQQVPLKPDQLTVEFMFEILKRIVQGSPAGTVAIPLASLYNLLDEFLNVDPWQVLNKMPGAPAFSGNYAGNWESRLPSAEKLGKIQGLIQELAEPVYRPFGEVVSLSVQAQTRSEQNHFKALAAEVKRNAVAYQAMRQDDDGKMVGGPWTVWEAPEGTTPLLEVAIEYSGKHEEGGHENKSWAVVNLGIPALDPEATYLIHDLIAGTSQRYDGETLRRRLLPVGMNTELPRHHFVLLKSNS